MRNILTLVLAPLVLLIAASCGGGTPEERALSTFEEVVTTLEGIESPEDIEAAKSELESLGDEMKSIEEEKGGEPEFTDEQQEKMEALMGRMMAEMQRLATMEGVEGLMEALQTTGPK